MKPRTSVRDLRAGMGQPAGHIDLPTFGIPADCICTWGVIRPGPGWACISRLRYRNSLCSHKHIPSQGAGRTP